MEREKAIAVLMAQMLVLGKGFPTYREAMEMAISALREQEELEKLCSERGALLDEICGMCNLCKHYCDGNGDECCRECGFDSRFEWRGLPKEGAEG